MPSIYAPQPATLFRKIITGFSLFLLPLVTLAGVHSKAAPRCDFTQRKIVVDGDLKDWAGIAPNVVRGREHLWFGQGMTPEQWTGDDDLSYQWRGAWFGDQLYFAIEVTDDRLLEPSQASSFFCDCVGIYLDYNNQGGRRVKVLDGREDWFAKCDPRELMGYELHFLPTDPARVYLDHADKYALDKPQTDRFKRDWNGNAAFRKTARGYVIEVGFRVPGVPLQAGKTMGVEIGVCDDDGKGRESIMMWTGTKSDFWVTMDEYGKATLTEPVKLESRRNNDGSWGVAVDGQGLASVIRRQPVELEFWLGPGKVTNVFAGYHSVDGKGNTLTGKATLSGPNESRFEVEDRWRQEGAVVRLERNVSVSGNATNNGFMSGFQFDFVKPLLWTDAEWFAPGMIYGGFEHLTETAIGGKANYRPGNYTVRIREDRLPAPLFLARFKDNAWVAVLNPNPRGDTTAFEALDVKGAARINARFQFGAIGGQRRDGRLSVGFWFPGSEGEVTYAGNTYPGGQMHQWRRRYHPIKDGFAHRWQVAFRFGRDDSFPASYANAWRWAWEEIKPVVVPHDIDQVRRCLVDALAANVMQVEDRAGIPNAIPCVPGRPENPDPKTVMGFTGKALESAEFLLAESRLDNTERGERLRALAEKIIASFLRLKIAPPEGEGFYIKSGKTTTARGHLKLPEVYLRSFGDDIKALLRAYEREKKAGHDRPEWLAWARQFADWLLTQQQPGGGFPRSWLPPDGAVHSDSPNSSFNAIPLLVQLNRLTNEPKYLDAARCAGDFCWANGQSRGRFVGGTIDNPDVLDKEAGTLSLEAYLALYEATKESKWLARAKAAADYAETWIYTWNVPMPDDADNAALHWKRGVPTVGLQLIATGHSLVDQYMSFDADEYARLYKHTGDEHYLDVARILLHNTKAMLALPGRAYDLRAPGWQQEHWSLAPRRGFGLHRLWLPWVSTSHLNGIFGLMEFDKELFDKLAEPTSSRPNIVLILADDLGFSDIGCYGGEIQTPNLDALAAQGVRFSQFYNNARCCPSRATVMTGLYPHQAGVGDMVDEYARRVREALRSPAYTDRLNPGTPTIAEALQMAGYRTYMAGKWHLGYRTNEWPAARGFDRSFAVIEGAMNYYGFGMQHTGIIINPPMALDREVFVPPREGFFATDAFAERATQFVREHGKRPEPFFLYFAPTAPHWPLHARPETIAKYRGKYRAGWDAVRAQRLARLQQFGALDPRWLLSPRPAVLPAWDTLDEARKDRWDERMAVYAAMVEELDTAIGRILQAIRETGQETNTVVMFLSDNGGAPENPNRSQPGAVLGSRDSYEGYTLEGAHVSCAPFRKTKIFTHEGGIATPFIVRWLGGIPSTLAGKWIRETGHIMDLPPTCLDLAGAWNTRLEGESLVPLLRGETIRRRHPIFWEHEGHRAVLDGEWKLVASRGDPWELYNLKADRTELDNLAGKMPEKVAELSAKYNDWARRVGVKPWPRLK